MKIAIDTNVPIAANGRDTHATLACQLRCIEFLELIASEKSNTTVVLDEGGLLLNEYTPHLYHCGQPGVGDIFFKFLHDHMYDGMRVQFTRITPTTDLERGFEELPRNKLDPSDRKILAIAVTSKSEIVNALDTDWHQQIELLNNMKINIQQLCPEHGCII